MLESQKLKLRRRVKTGFYSLLAAALIGGAVYLVWFSPAFKIQDIEVSGAMLADVAAVRDGLGRNILFWSPPQGLLSSAAVANVGVEKQLLDRRVVVRVEERRKALIWCLKVKRKCFWTDEKGVVFSDAPDTEGPLVVKVVQDYTDRDVGMGERALPEEYFQNLVKIFDLLDVLRLPIDEVRIDNLKFREATVEIANGPALYFSLEIDPKFAGSVIKSLRASPQWSQMRYVDLRVENRAYYSL